MCGVFLHCSKINSNNNNPLFNLIQWNFPSFKFIDSNSDSHIQKNSSKRFLFSITIPKTPTIDFKCNAKITRLKSKELKRVIQTSSFVWHQLFILLWIRTSYWTLYDAHVQCQWNNRCLVQQHMNTEYLWKNREREREKRSRLHVFA